MPDNRNQMRFNAEYMARVDQAITRVIVIFNKIIPKLRAGRQGECNRVLNALIGIKQYAYQNSGRIPYSDQAAEIKHDAKNVRKIRNAKQSLKVLYATLRAPLQKENKPGYAKALDLFNEFENHLTKIVIAEDNT